ncbi:putative phosphotyrosyl phosphatase activator [Babesia divergens]|uniref:Serine/threonine-protein phosphatase 2A activator n=1 Tax=Babesia divergens TaxID=32595 RepID=A0AAD9LHE8_BABDI|nr:putative phosphotyrosyl phosphatase activator [Babesia divergens]
MATVDKRPPDMLNKAIIDFVIQLNDAVIDKPIADEICTETTQEEKTVSSTISRLISVLNRIEELTVHYKPEDHTGCRFGSKAHSIWLNHISEIWDEVADELGITKADLDEGSKLKMRMHFLNSFGSNTRVDYGTGHEIQFTWFLKCLYDANLLNEEDLSDLVLRVMSRYFKFVRYLIDRYNLEPAGSKGAWGIDHYQFLPFLLGSAQLKSNIEVVPQWIVQQGNTSTLTERYIFLQTMEYIKKKLKGLTLEIAAPMLFAICNSCGWRKINSGLIKMYKDDIVNISRIKHRC